MEAYLHTNDIPQKLAMRILKTANEFYGGSWAGILFRREVSLISVHRLIESTSNGIRSIRNRISLQICGNSIRIGKEPRKQAYRLLQNGI